MVVKGQGLLNKREKKGLKQDVKRKQGMKGEYVCIVCLHNASAKKIKTFLVIISAWNLRSFMHISTCYVCLYIASAKKNLTVCWDESSINEWPRLRFSKVEVSH